MKKCKTGNKCIGSIFGACIACCLFDRRIEMCRAPIELSSDGYIDHDRSSCSCYTPCNHGPFESFSFKGEDLQLVQYQKTVINLKITSKWSTSISLMVINPKGKL